MKTRKSEVHWTPSIISLPLSFVGLIAFIICTVILQFIVALFLVRCILFIVLVAQRAYAALLTCYMHIPMMLQIVQ